MDGRAGSCGQRGDAERLAILEAVLRSCSTPIFSIDAQGRYTSFNESHAAVMREVQGAEIEMGGDFLAYFSQPEAREAAAARLERALSGERVHEDALFGVPGSARHYDVTYDPIRDEGGVVRGAAVQALDATSYVEAMRALRESEESYRSLFDDHVAVKLIIDPDTGRIVDANPAAVEYYGWSREEMQAMNIDQINTLSHDEVVAAMERARAARTVRFEFRHRLADGSIRDVDVVSSTVSMGGRECLYSIVTDSTERRRTEQALRESEQRLDEVATQSGSVVWEVDADGLFTFVNRVAASVYGRPPEELVGRMHFFDLHPETGREEFAARIMAGFARAEVFTGYEAPIERADGRLAWVTTDAVPMLGPDGGLLGYRGSNTDITERKRAADEILALNAGLERRVAERTRELSAANRELEEFVYSVSHDLRGPLRAIDGFSHAVLEEHGEAIGQQGRSDLERVRAAAQRMGDLIDALLSLTRVTRQDVRRELVDLSATARRILAGLAAAQPERVVVWDVQEGVFAESDRALVEVVLANLLENAWKFTAHATTAHIGFVSEERDGRRIFAVRDDGAGFDPVYADKLFQPFERLHAPDDYPGTGIGLATVKRVVERLGGECWAEGAEGEGAALYFTLP